MKREKSLEATPGTPGVRSMRSSRAPGLRLCRSEKPEADCTGTKTPVGRLPRKVTPAIVKRPDSVAGTYFMGCQHWL